MTSAAHGQDGGDPFASLRAPKQEISEEAKEARRRPGLAESIAGYAEAREQDARSAAKPRCEAAYAIPSYWPDEVLRGRIASLRAMPRPLSRENGLRLGAALEEAHRRRMSRV